MIAAYKLGFEEHSAFSAGSYPLKTITILGNTPIQAIIAIVAVIWLYLRQYKSEAIFVGASGLLASILIVSLKYIYQRQRPSITHLVHASDYSFPSGHSSNIMILGAIAIVLVQRLEKKESKIVVYAITGLLIFLVGLSRIYVGVHYPTDVLAGFYPMFGLLNARFIQLMTVFALNGDFKANRNKTICSSELHIFVG